LIEFEFWICRVIRDDVINLERKLKINGIGRLPSLAKFEISTTSGLGMDGVENKFALLRLK